MWLTVARNLQLQRGGRTGPIVTCPSPDRTDPSDPNPANPNPADPNPADPNPAASSPLGAVNKAPKRSGHSFLTHLTTTAATTTTTTSAANPTTTTTATRSNNISFDSPFKGLSSSQHATTATAAPTPSKKGKKGKEKALLPITLALTFSGLMDQIVSLLVNNLAFKEIVEYTGLARKLALTQILKEEEKKALIFPLFVA
ncbi:hypothetical protein P8C59_000221 [Phyllachora maydis]|uniref:Uncharacterized protein n=1 Tax=Phyllachora maydis TaxID=1825666 RepID=A0AAD9M797_9PEZI|nr:hypothetical protein P8C59_000221 [Phyllachora maydis]